MDRCSRCASPSRIRSQLAEEHVRSWPIGRPFRLLEAMRALCSDITVQLVLGVTDPHRRDQLAAAIRQMLNTPGNPPLPLPGDHDGPGGMAGRLGERLFQRRSAGVRRLLMDELSQRHARENPGEDVLGTTYGRARNEWSSARPYSSRTAADSSQQPSADTQLHAGPTDQESRSVSRRPELDWPPWRSTSTRLKERP